MNDHTPIAPVRPVAAYVGGKRALAAQLVTQIAATPHNHYIEPFVGMGGVFFRRTSRPRGETINDRSRDVTNLFRILQRHYPQFMDTLKWQLASRAEFDRLMQVDPETLTDLERAGRFLYLQKLGYGGKVADRAFGVTYGFGARFNLAKLAPMLEDVHERLQSVVIECKPFDELIQRYDRRDVLFYCDPPYWGSTDYYGKNMFSEADYEVLKGCLTALQGRFILSINDVPQIRELFTGFRIEPVLLNYRFNGVTAARELIISN